MPPSFEWDIEEQSGPRRKISERLRPPSQRQRWLRRSAVLFVLLVVMGLGIRSGRADPFAPAPGLTPSDRPGEIKQVRDLGGTARVELVRWFQEPIFYPTKAHPEPAAGQSPPPPPLPHHLVLSSGREWHLASRRAA